MVLPGEGLGGGELAVDLGERLAGQLAGTAVDPAEGIARTTAPAAVVGAAGILRGEDLEDGQ